MEKMDMKFVIFVSLFCGIMIFFLGHDIGKIQEHKKSVEEITKIQDTYNILEKSNKLFGFYDGMAYAEFKRRGIKVPDSYDEFVKWQDKNYDKYNKIQEKK